MTPIHIAKWALALVLWAMTLQARAQGDCATPLELTGPSHDVWADSSVIYRASTLYTADLTVYDGGSATFLAHSALLDGVFHVAEGGVLLVEDCSGTVGLSAQAAQVGTLEVFPNPSTGPIAVRTPDGTRLHLIEVYALSGGRLAQLGPLEAGGTHHFDLKGLPSGVYVLRAVSDGGRVFLQRVVVGR